MTDPVDAEYQTVTDSVAKLLRIPVLAASKIVSYIQVRNVIIRAEYWTRRRGGEKSETLWIDLSKKYALSKRHIERIISRK